MIRLSILNIAMMAAAIFSTPLLSFAETYTVDPSHTNIGFSVPHLGISKVTGSFSQFSGTVEIDPKLKNKLTSVEATVEVKSINTGNEKRDRHLKDKDFFDAESHPTIHFKSTSVRRLRDNRYNVKGNLTLRGVTQEITLKGKLLGVIDSQKYGKRAGFTATGTIQREAFGMTWNKLLETGGFVVGDEVQLQLDVEVIAQ